MEDHCRFKALCALKQTTMRAEIQVIVAAEIATGMLMSEVVAQFEDAARAREISPEELVTVAKKSGGPKLVRQQQQA